MLNFVLFKCMALGLSAGRSLLLAMFLGPASYGLFGTLIIIQQYLSYAALGMREGVVVGLVQTSLITHEQARIRCSALLWGVVAGMAVALISVGLYLFGVLSSHYVWVGVIAFLSIVNEILINISRAAEQLRKIALLEVLYNLAPLIVLLLMWKSVTVTAVLMALAAGLFVSVCGYLLTLKHWGDWQPDCVTVRRLLGIGLPLALLSGLILLVNSVYVLLGSRMLNDMAQGKVVFAANVCTILLFALNAVAWASTSRSMRTLYIADQTEVERLRAERIRLGFRLCIVTAVLLALASRWVLPVVLPAYTGADEFILYFCLLQSYGLMLFEEINFLTVSDRSRRVIVGYALLLLAMLTPALLLPSLAFATLIKLGIISNCLLAVITTLHCRVPGGTLGLDHRAKLVFLLFPLAVVALYSVAGTTGAVLACAVFVPMPLRALLTARAPRLAAVRSLP